jgi:hypothetical protein
MLIRMLTHISGGRNGVPWPPAGGTIEVPDDEGASLIRADIAVASGKDAKAVMDQLAEQPTPGHPSKVDARPPSQVEGERLAAEAAAAQEAAPAVASSAEPPGELPSLAPDVAGQDEAGGAGNAEEDAAESSPVAEAPGPSAPKQAWIDYAVSTGAGPDTAAAMTKADLMSRYGGRL